VSTRSVSMSSAGTRLDKLGRQPKAITPTPTEASVIRYSGLFGTDDEAHAAHRAQQIASARIA
jgi:hypothetical protein